MIYSDISATTRISDSVFEQMLPFLREQKAREYYISNRK